MSLAIPPFEVRVIYSPTPESATGTVGDGDPKAAKPMPLPEQLFRLLQEDTAIAAGSPGIPVYLHEGTRTAYSLTPPAIPEPSAGKTLYVALLTTAMMRSPQWISDIAALRKRCAASAQTAFFQPILLDAEAFNEIALGDTNGERAFLLESQVEIDRGVRIAVLRRIASMLNDNKRLHVFVSHAKKDGARVGRAVAAVSDELKMDAWLDIEQIDSGDNFASKLGDAIAERTIFVAVVSDAYSTREWCRWEAQIAKQRGLAIVVLDMVNEGQRRSLPSLGNVPVVRYNAPENLPENGDLPLAAKIAYRRVVEAALQEAVARAYFPLRVARLRRTLGVDDGRANPMTFSPAPDLVRLVANLDNLAVSGAAVYPDPPLPPLEIDQMRRVVGEGVTVTTPLSMLAGRSHAPKTRVAISISRCGADELAALGMAPLHVDALLAGLSRYLLSTGHELAYGGAPGRDLTEQLCDTERLHRYGTKRQAALLHNYVAQYIADGNAAEAKAAGKEPTNGTNDVMWAHVVERPRLGRESTGKMQTADLTAMRLRMADECGLRIVASGDRKPGGKGMRRAPGILEEAYIAVTRQMPLIVIGGFGGNAAEIAAALQGNPPDTAPTADHFLAATDLVGRGFDADYATMFAAFNPQTDLHNGLTTEENTRLFVSTDVDEIVALIVTSINRLAS